jgi:two-component system alkaline phosphatase synthesis response regulator PhoP
MSRGKILVIEDEADLREILKANLGKEGYAVLAARDGEAGLKMARAESPDAIILDLMLPGMDGLEICRLLKRDSLTAGIPVLMATAKAEDVDVVTGLEVGADDYITKPFSVRVLVARLRTILRRHDGAVVAEKEVIRVRDIVIDTARHEVKMKGKPVDLTFTEFRVLSLLAGQPGRVFTRDQIVTAVHGESYPVTDRAVDVQIVGLRRKLGTHGDSIETVRGVGYRFTNA